MREIDFNVFFSLFFVRRFEMIARNEEGKLDITLLEVQRPLSEAIIKEYDHKEVMKDIHNIFVQLQDNFFEQAVYQEYLKYTITEDLEFVIVEDPSLKIKNINENNLKLGSEISFKRFTKKDYKKEIKEGRINKGL